MSYIKYYAVLLAALSAFAPVNAFSDETDEAFEESVSNEDMSEYRAAAGNTAINANVTDNISVGSVSGDNTISESAFAQANGVVNVIQNSGNNVAIQSATEVNVVIN